jgi:hypothetical protein
VGRSWASSSVGHWRSIGHQGLDPGLGLQGDDPTVVDSELVEHDGVMEVMLVITVLSSKRCFNMPTPSHCISDVRFKIISRCSRLYIHNSFIYVCEHTAKVARHNVH